MSFRLSPRAERDLEEIWDYTVEAWSQLQADAYLGQIFETLERLATGAEVGRPVIVRDGYLKVPVGRHLVFYREGKDGVDVIRILHQRMDVDRHL